MKIKKIVFNIFLLIYFIPTIFATELVFQFNSPSFSGIGYTQHILNIYNQEQSAIQRIEDQKARKQSRIELEQLRNPIYRFTQALESRMYQELAKKVTDNLFGENQITSGTIDFPSGGGIFYSREDENINLIITDINGSITQIKVPVQTIINDSGSF
jgi:hypothetical protein